MKYKIVEDTIAWLKTHPDRTMDTMVFVGEEENEQLQQVMLDKIRPGEYVIFHHHHDTTSLLAFFRANEVHRIIVIGENGIKTLHLSS